MCDNYLGQDPKIVCELEPRAHEVSESPEGMVSGQPQETPRNKRMNQAAARIQACLGFCIPSEVDSDDMEMAELQGSQVDYLSQERGASEYVARRNLELVHASAERRTGQDSTLGERVRHGMILQTYLERPYQTRSGS